MIRYSWLKLFDFYSPSSTYLLENPTWTLHRSAYLYSSYSWIYTTDVSLHITGIITLLAEKLNTTIITERHNDGLVSRETAAAIKQAQQENQHFLRIPRRFVSITDLFQENNIKHFIIIFILQSFKPWDSHWLNCMKGCNFFIFLYLQTWMG